MFIQTPDYTIVTLPNEAPPTQTWQSVKVEIKLRAEAVHHSAAVISQPQQPLPVWYGFMLFYELYQRCLEIAVEIQNKQALLLYSRLDASEVARPAKIIIYPELLESATPAVILKNNEDRIINLTALAVVTMESMFTFVQTFKQQMQRTEKIIFTGSTDLITALVAFRIAFDYAKHIDYRIGSDTISIY